MCAKKTTIVYTKDDPIYIKDVDDLKVKLPTINCKYSFYKYNCSNCNKEVVKVIKRDISRNLFICSRCKRINTSLERYGVKSATALKETQDKIKKTCLERYGTESSSQNKDVIQKMLNTQRERYGCDPRMTAESRAKAKETFIERFGCDNPLGNKDIREKARQTMIKRYGTENYWQNASVRKKVKQTCLKKYGSEYYITSEQGQEALHKFLEKNNVTNTSYIPEVKEKIKQKAIERAKEFGTPFFKYEFCNEKFDSSWELAYWIYCKEHDIPIEREPYSIEYLDDDGKNHLYFPDFRINNNQLIEIKGGHLLNEDNQIIDLKTKKILYKKTECLKHNNVKIISKNDIYQYIDYVKDKYTSDFLFLFRKNIPFPYVNKDFSNTTDYGIIQHFHKSIFDASKEDKLSPKKAWENKDLILKSALNRLKHIGSCKPSDILQGFNVAKIAPKVSVFKPKFAENLIKKYLNDYSQIFDPFSGFSGRLIGAMNCNKQYIGQDINADHVKESNEIINYKNYKNCCVTQQDILTDTSKDFESLFTCPPYGGKEHWNENNDEIEKSCDEWIDICLNKYKCKKYLFVVDKTEKYKDYIIDKIKNRSHFGSNFEYIILI